MTSIMAPTSKNTLLLGHLDACALDYSDVIVDHLWLTIYGACVFRGRSSNQRNKLGKRVTRKLTIVR